jgi:hypothetical protein
MAFRDFLIAPRGDDRHPSQTTARDGRGGFFARRRRSLDPAAQLAPSLGVLACARDVRALAVGAGTIVARGHRAALVCVCGPGDEPGAAGMRAPARAEAARLATSLRARGLQADTRGKVALVDAGRTDDSAAVAARALAAAGPLPTVLAVAARDPDVDVLLAAQDAIVVALPPSVEPALVELTTTGAADLAADVAAVVVALDPASRTLALAGLRAPAALREVVHALVGPDAARSPS